MDQNMQDESMINNIVELMSVALTKEKIRSCLMQYGIVGSIIEMVHKSINKFVNRVR